ncbi:MAG: fibronectin type III domain-containing protein, partial [Roseiflexaceae bacterium]
AATPAPTSAPQPTAAPTSPPVPTSAPNPGTTGAGCPQRYAVDGRAATFVEAERYTARNGRFTEITDPSRSGGVAMTIPGSGMRKDLATYLSFDLDVTNGGKFYVWLLSYGPSSSADSFTVQIDSGKATVASLPRDGWAWKRTSGTFALSNGAHSLVIKNREDGASVDQILLTSDAHYTPAGFGNSPLTPRCG